MSCNRCQNIVLIHLLLFTVVFSYAQDGIGIGTKTPRKTLEIAGDMKISQNIDIGVIENLEDDDTSTFLIQDTDQSIKILDVSNPTGAALGYIQEYVITNPQGDWVLDFDTGVPSDDYVLISLSAYFDKELVMSGNAQDNASIPYTSAFIRNNTWHIIADFPVATNRDNSEIGTWIISTLIYSKDLSKQFGVIEVPMANTSTGVAPMPIID